MNIFAYVEALIAAGTPMAYFCLGILGFFALSVLWELLHGLRRGFVRQIAHTICMLAAAAIAFFLTSSACTTALTVGDIVITVEGAGTEIPAEVVGIIMSFDPETLQYIAALPVSAIIAPIMFAFLFIIINLAFKVIYYIIRKIARMGRGHGLFRRLGGLVLGAVEGALVASIILLPVSGITATVDGAVNAMREDEANAEIVAAYDAEAAPLANCPIFPLINGLGGDAILNSFATVDIDGTPENMREMLVSGVEMGAQVMKLSEIYINSLTPTDKVTISAIIDSLKESDYFMTLLSGVLRGVARAADDGYITITAEAPFDKIINTLIDVFEGSTKDNLGDDLDTIKDVFFILSDEGVITAIDSGDDAALTEAFTKEDGEGNTVIRRVISILNQNEHTRPLVTTLTEISVAMLSESMGFDGDTAELYANVKDGIKEVLTINPDDYTGDGYVEAVTESLNGILTENDINLEPEIVSTMAEYIESKYDELDLENITDDEINDIILSYYDAYLEYLKQNPDANPGGGNNNPPIDGDDNIDDDGVV